MPEQSEPEQLYVVWELPFTEFVDGNSVRRGPDRPSVVTDPKTLAEAQQWANDNAWAFAGHLDVAPATQADLDDADDVDSGPVAKPVTYACTGCDWHSGRDWDPAEKCPLCGSDIAADLDGEA